MFSNRKSLETDSISKGTSNLLIEFMRSQQLAEEGRTRQVEKQRLYEDWNIYEYMNIYTENSKHVQMERQIFDTFSEVLNLIARHYVAAFLPDAT